MGNETISKWIKLYYKMRNIFKLLILFIFFLKMHLYSVIQKKKTDNVEVITEDANSVIDWLLSTQKAMD